MILVQSKAFKYTEKKNLTVIRSTPYKETKLYLHFISIINICISEIRGVASGVAGAVTPLPQ